MRTWLVFSGDTPDVQLNFLRQGFRKLLFDRQVTRDHFRLRDKDGDPTIRSPVVKKPMLHANLMALSFIELELWAIEVYTAGIGILDVPLLWPWPWPNDLHIRSWPVRGDIPNVKIGTSYVKAFESYRLIW